MSAPSVDVIRRGGERVRTGPWRGDRRVAYLAPLPSAPLPSAAFLRHCLETLAARGYQRAVTPALAPLEATAFLAAGFDLEERLHLLGLDLTGLPEGVLAARSPLRLKRVRPTAMDRVLAVDHAAFPPFWRLDRAGVAEAVDATPRTRFRSAAGIDGGLRGYAICGRAGPRGFVQRLAVLPETQRQGVGRALLSDGLRWMGRRGVRRVMVNTQYGNVRALSLYLAIGFQEEPVGLSVLSVGLA